MVHAGIRFLVAFVYPSTYVAVKNILMLKQKYTNAEAMLNTVSYLF